MRDTELLLAAPPPQLRRLLTITGTDELFTTCPSVRATLDLTLTADPPGR